MICRCCCYHTHIDGQTHMLTYIDTCVCIHTHTHTRTCMYTCTRTFMQTHVYTHIHTYTYMHAYKHTHTYILRATYQHACTHTNLQTHVPSISLFLSLTPNLFLYLSDLSIPLIFQFFHISRYVEEDDEHKDWCLDEGRAFQTRHRTVSSQFRRIFCRLMSSKQIILFIYLHIYLIIYLFNYLIIIWTFFYFQNHSFLLYFCDNYFIIPYLFLPGVIYCLTISPLLNNISHLMPPGKKRYGIIKIIVIENCGSENKKEFKKLNN